MSSSLSPDLLIDSALAVQVEERDWLSLHLHYTGDYRSAVLGRVRPLAASLLNEGRIDSFFFVRYQDEIGPHVRLRLRLLSGVAETARLLGSESVRPSPFELELERYGGSEAFPRSLDFFAVSSAHAIDYLERYGDRPRERQRILTLCILLWQACGFAQDEEELLGLLDYRRGWKEKMAPVNERAELLFQSNKDGYLRVVDEQIKAVLGADGPPEGPVDPGAAMYLASASATLSRELRHLDREARQSVGCSQIHMTANRLGLSLGEESLAAHLLTRSAQELLAGDARFRRRIEESFTRRRETWRSVPSNEGS